MSEMTIRGTRVTFESVGAGPAVLLLHGWGGCIASMSPIAMMLRDEYRVVSVDLPGFGLSERPGATWGSADYAECVSELLTQIGVPELAAIVGHSFGGKVAITLALAHPAVTRSLVLVGTPGVRLPLSATARRRQATVKAARRLARVLPAFLRKALEARLLRMGSQDYRDAGEMRPILVRVVNEDLRPELPALRVPTLLVWGEHDTAAPPEIAHEMESLIPGSGLVLLPQSAHFPYLDEPRAFSAVLRSFLSSICSGAAS